ncbi:MAG: hypothetical protein AAF458_05030 [Pseudomonadota bacterium]
MFIDTTNHASSGMPVAPRGGTGNLDATGWSPEIISRLHQAIAETLAQTAVCRTFLPILPCSPRASTISNGLWTADKVAPHDRYVMTARSDHVEPLVELFVDFALTRPQVESEPHARHGESLARRATAALANAEDFALVNGWPSDPQQVDSAALPASRYVRAVIPAGVEQATLIAEPIGPAVAPRDTPNPIFTEPARPLHAANLAARTIAAADALHEHGLEPPFVLLLSPWNRSQLGLRRTYDEYRVTPQDLLPDDIKTIADTRSVSDERALLIATGGQPVQIRAPSRDYELALTEIDAEGRFNFRLSFRFALQIRGLYPPIAASQAPDAKPALRNPYTFELKP